MGPHAVWHSCTRHAQALTVRCKDCPLHSRISTQLAESSPLPSPSCLSRYSAGVGKNCRQTDELLYEAEMVEKGCDRLLASPQTVSGFNSYLPLCLQVSCPLLEAARILGLPLYVAVPPLRTSIQLPHPKTEL